MGKARNKPFGSSSAKFGNYPLGCFYYSNGKFYFNKGTKGKAHTQARPVCKKPKKKTTKKPKKKTTKKPKKKTTKKMGENFSITLGSLNKADCGKLATLKSEERCRAEAKARNKPFGSSSAKFGAYPLGCFYYNNGKFYFNKGTKGKAHTQARPVCKKPKKK